MWDFQLSLGRHSVDECLHGQSVVDPIVPEETHNSAILALGRHSVDECLHGQSVVDPIVPEETHDSAILASEAVGTEPSATAHDAPAAPMPPNPEAMSSPDWADYETSSLKDASTPASLLSSGPIDVPSPESSQDLFNRLLAAPVLADSTESDSRLASVPPDIELFSDPAGQDRIRELMLELPILNLE